MSKRRESVHLKAQRDGKIRDGYRCQICGSTDHTEGHHIIEYHNGGRGDRDNIVTLCHKCHSKVHGGGLDIYFF